MLLDCPRCGPNVAKRLIGNKDGIFCDRCYQDDRTGKFNYTLHQKTLGVSNGKAWEIDNRIVSKDDGKTVINRVTGKPAQY